MKEWGIAGFISETIYMIFWNYWKKKEKINDLSCSVLPTLSHSSDVWALVKDSSLLCLMGWKASTASQDRRDLIFICERLWTPLNDTLQRLDVLLPFPS